MVVVVALIIHPSTCNGLPDPFINCLQLLRLLRGVKRVQGSSSLKRLSITIDILQVIKCSLTLYSRDHAMLWAANGRGFFGFLSAGKFTTNTPFVPSIHLGVSDVPADSLGDATCFTKFTSSVQGRIPYSSRQ